MKELWEFQRSDVAQNVHVQRLVEVRRTWEDYQRTRLHVTLDEADAWLTKLEAGEDADLPECHV